MKLLEVDIIEYSNEYFPGFVTCSFIDAFGKIWYIDEKTPVVLSDDIVEDTELPIKGYVAGEVISRKGDLVCFCTEKPWCIETREGVNKFYVYERQLLDKKIENPYLFVDFNEGIIPFELYLLSKSDMKLDIDANPVEIYAGMKIYVWDGDVDDSGEECILVANGVAELNTIEEGTWSFKKVKWCCRVDGKSFRHEKKDSSRWDKLSKRFREANDKTPNA